MTKHYIEAYFMTDENTAPLPGDETAPRATHTHEIAQQVADFESRVVEILGALADKVGNVGQRVDAALKALQGTATGQEAADSSNGTARHEPVAPAEDGMQGPDEMIPAAHTDTAPVAAPGEAGSPSADRGADSAISAIDDAPPGPHAARAIAERAQSLQVQDGPSGLSGGL